MGAEAAHVNVIGAGITVAAAGRAVGGFAAIGHFVTACGARRRGPRQAASAGAALSAIAIEPIITGGAGRTSGDRHAEMIRRRGIAIDTDVIASRSGLRTGLIRKTTIIWPTIVG
jgi:hypothetical protein